MRNKGFTIIELLIALALGLLVSMAAMQAINSYLRAEETTHKLNDLLLTSETTFNLLTQDLHWSDDAYYDPVTRTLTMVRDTETGSEFINYVWNGDDILRNGIQVNPPDVLITGLEVNQRAPLDDLKILHIKLNLEHASIIGSRAVHESQTSISLRNKEISPE